VQVAAVFVVTEQPERLAPDPPLTVNNPLRVSESHRQGAGDPVQVKVSVGVVLVAPVVGEMVNPAVPTVIGAVTESVVSVMVQVPAEVVEMLTVSCVAEVLDELTKAQPDAENTVPLVHVVNTPVQVKAIVPEWFAGMVAGVQLKVPSVSGKNPAAAY